MDEANNKKETNLMLSEILKTLKNIEQLLISQNSKTETQMDIQDEKTHPQTLDVMELINVVSEKEEQLIPTIKALLSSDGASAVTISEITKRSRSRENQHLNKLVELGYVQKIREGREVKFFISH